MYIYMYAESYCRLGVSEISYFNASSFSSSSSLLLLLPSFLFHRAIRPSELVDASWTKDDKKEDASPNLLKMSRFENKVREHLTVPSA